MHILEIININTKVHIVVNIEINKFSIFEVLLFKFIKKTEVNGFNLKKCVFKFSLTVKFKNIIDVN